MFNAWINLFKRRQGKAAPMSTPAMSTGPAHAAHVLSLRPLIIFIGDTTLRLLHLIPRDFDPSICFLHGVWWTLEVPGVAEGKAREHAEHLHRRPQDRFVNLCNAPAELPIARAAGLEAVLAPHNSFVDEKIFRPLPASPPAFDAVYNAAFHAWKRHELAAEIQRLCLIGYFHGRPIESEDSYYDALRRRLPHAHICNEIPGVGRRVLSPEDVNAILNRARVGIVLSEAEGGNFASMEYMLSGLPVVSTPSKGGRDYFFDPDYCLIVPPDPRSIRDATMALAARAIPRSYIRAETLERVARERKRFIDFVQNLYDDAGVSRRFAQEWPSVFVHKMLRGHGVDEFWRDLSERLAAPDGAD